MPFRPENKFYQSALSSPISVGTLDLVLACFPQCSLVIFDCDNRAHELFNVLRFRGFYMSEIMKSKIQFFFY